MSHITSRMVFGTMVENFIFAMNRTFVFPSNGSNALTGTSDRKSYTTTLYTFKVIAIVKVFFQEPTLIRPTKNCSEKLENNTATKTEKKGAKPICQLCVITRQEIFIWYGGIVPRECERVLEKSSLRFLIPHENPTFVMRTLQADFVQDSAIS